jgi:hypothetical protein
MAAWRDNRYVLWEKYDSHELIWKQEQFFNFNLSGTYKYNCDVKH